jgi:hypothetical protein
LSEALEFGERYKRRKKADSELLQEIFDGKLCVFEGFMFVGGEPINVYFISYDFYSPNDCLEPTQNHLRSSQSVGHTNTATTVFDAVQAAKLD